MKPVFSLRNIEKHHSMGCALDIDALELHPGRIYALTGPNGAGKSTLLQLLALLLPPTRGELCYRGEPVPRKGARLKHLRREITLVHQSPYLFHTTVYRNLAFGLSLRGIDRHEQRRRIAAALESVGLGGFEHRRARELSGGEIQRVALARAIALTPEVLLLDEPSSSLQHDLLPMLDEVLEGCRRRGATVILSTHDPSQARRLDCESIRLDSGRLLTGCCTLPRRTVESSGNGTLGSFAMEVSGC